jgi:hypothetical protein
MLLGRAGHSLEVLEERGCGKTACSRCLVLLCVTRPAGTIRIKIGSFIARPLSQPAALLGGAKALVGGNLLRSGLEPSGASRHWPEYSRRKSPSKCGVANAVTTA